MPRPARFPGNFLGVFARRAGSLCLMLAWLVASAAPVRYFYCKMAQRTHASACCVGDTHGEERRRARALNEPTSVEEPSSPCCQPRVSASLHASYIAAHSLGVTPFVRELWLLLPSAWQWPEDLRLARERWPIRAGPGSGSEQRAFLQVFLN